MDVGTDIQVRENEGCREVFDPVRRRWVALTPEEWVRQHTILRLQAAGYPLEVMQVEGAIEVNGMSRRCDIVVYCSGQPWMIVECKKKRNSHHPEGLRPSLSLQHCSAGAISRVNQWETAGCDRGGLCEWAAEAAVGVALV